MRDPDDRCASTNGARRCVLRPHPIGDHLALVPEGDPNARPESWGRLPDDGPSIGDWLALVLPLPAFHTGGLVPSPDPGPAPSAGPPPATSASSEPLPASGSVGGIPVVVSPSAPPGEVVVVAGGKVAGRAVNIGQAGSTGYTGDPCETCGSMRMVRTGTCATCQDCGSAGGCG